MVNLPEVLVTDALLDALGAGQPVDAEDPVVGPLAALAWLAQEPPLPELELDVDPEVGPDTGSAVKPGGSHRAVGPVRLLPSARPAANVFTSMADRRFALRSLAAGVAVIGVVSTGGISAAVTGNPFYPVTTIIEQMAPAPGERGRINPRPGESVDAHGDLTPAEQAIVDGLLPDSLAPDAAAQVPDSRGGPVGLAIGIGDHGPIPALQLPDGDVAAHRSDAPGSAAAADGRSSPAGTDSGTDALITSDSTTSDSIAPDSTTSDSIAPDSAAPVGTAPGEATGEPNSATTTYPGGQPAPATGTDTATESASEPTSEPAQDDPFTDGSGASEEPSPPAPTGEETPTTDDTGQSPSTPPADRPTTVDTDVTAPPIPATPGPTTPPTDTPPTDTPPTDTPPTDTATADVDEPGLDGEGTPDPSAEPAPTTPPEGELSDPTSDSPPETPRDVSDLEAPEPQRGADTTLPDEAVEQPAEDDTVEDGAVQDGAVQDDATGEPSVTPTPPLETPPLDGALPDSPLPTLPGF